MYVCFCKVHSCTHDDGNSCDTKHYYYIYQKAKAVIIGFSFQMNKVTCDVVIKCVSSSSEIQGMVSLQQQNLRKNLSEAEIASEGFVTNTYSTEFFTIMHDASPSIIAVDSLKGNAVVGYVLAATKGVASHHEFMRSFKLHLDTLHYNGESLGLSNYIMVGQVCIGKGYRGCGVFPAMYAKYKQQLSSVYQYCITDVSEHNPRSLRAHIKIGFQVLEKRAIDGEVWYTIIWDWNSTSNPSLHNKISQSVGTEDFPPRPLHTREEELIRPRPSPTLVVIRGPSASGKSSLSKCLLENWQQECGREFVYIEQDYIRNNMLKYVKDKRSASVDMIFASVTRALSSNYDVLLEGILNSAHYGSMLDSLLQSLPASNVFVFYLDVPLEETKLRHSQREKASVFGADKLDEWYSSASPLRHPKEVVLSTQLKLVDMAVVVMDTMKTAF